MMIINNFFKGFYVVTKTLEEKGKNYWLVEIFDKKKEFAKEFIALEQSNAELKAFEWIKGKNKFHEKYKEI